MPDPPLANDVVALRAWSERDIPFIVAACQDPLIDRFTAAIPYPYGEPDARAWLAGQEMFSSLPVRLSVRLVGVVEPV